jgi:hypothetical protein
VADTIEPAPVWERGLAATLYFFTAFFLSGWVIGHFTGNTTDQGFNLQRRSGLSSVCRGRGLFFHRPLLRRRHALGPHSRNRPAAAEVIGAAATKAWTAALASAMTGEMPGQLD